MDDKPTTISTKPREGGTPKPPERKHNIKLLTLADVETEDVQWLWYPYIPAGKLTILEGDPGLGKSWITCDLAARVSAGKPFPGQKEGLPPQKVLMMSAEDGLGDTVKPRIIAQGGNLNNIYVTDDFFILDAVGIRDLEGIMRQTAATIVFIDPIVAYMGAKVDMNKANEVRGLMQGLHDAAKRTGSAIVAVRHLRKSGSKNAKYSGLGSIDFTAAVRSGLQVGESKGGTRFMRHFKSNLAPEGASLAFSLGDKKFTWEGEFSDEQFERQAVSTRPKNDARMFIQDLLRDGPRLATEMLQAASEKGIKPRTLQEAKRGLVSTFRQDNAWHWQLTEREGIGAPHRPVSQPITQPNVTVTIPQTVVQPEVFDDDPLPEGAFEIALARLNSRQK